MSKVNQNHKITAYIYMQTHQYFFEGQPDECWPWLGSFTVGGIPRIKIDKIYYKAHRVTLLYSLGLQQSELYACHKPECKMKPNCVNWNHLYLGTPAQNTRDIINAENHDAFYRQGSAHPMAILIESDIPIIRERAKKGEIHKDLAAEYNVSRALITDIVNKKRWKHIK